MVSSFIKTLSLSSTNPVQNKAIAEALRNKMDRKEGQGLSDENFTTNYKKKLTDIEENAQVNKIEKISVDNVLIIPTNEKEVNINIFKQVNIEDNKGIIWLSNGLLIQYGKVTSEETIEVYYEQEFDFIPNLQITPLIEANYSVDIEDNKVFIINGSGEFLWSAIGLKKKEENV